MSTLLTFKSTVSVYLTYLIFKAAPIVAVVYYFTNWYWAIPTSIALLVIILIYSGTNNHHFDLTPNSLVVHPILSFWKKPVKFQLEEIQTLSIKYAAEKDSRQWLEVTQKTTSTTQKFRCDWLHLPDPEEDDDHHDHDHGSSSHELFELLEDEDFYNGSLQHLADSLKTAGITVQELYYT